MTWMSDPNQKVRVYKRVYALIMGALGASAVAMPLFIRGKLVLSDRIIIEEELLEMFLIALILSISLLISKLYEVRLRENRERIDRLAAEQRMLTNSLSEAYHYIGTVNVEVSELQNLFCDLDRYPQSRNDFKNMLCILADKTMMLAKSDWAVIRIIGLDNQRTLKECRRGKLGDEISTLRIGNRAILAGEDLNDLSIIGSRQRSPYFKTVCITGGGNLPAEARRIIEAIAGIAEMLFLIFSLQCQKQD